MKLLLPTKMNFWIPVYAIHDNPDIYSDSMKFDLERGEYENKEFHDVFSFW